MFDKTQYLYITASYLRNVTLREEKKLYFGKLLKYYKNLLSLPI